jgi:hypothetical protein
VKEITSGLAEKIEGLKKLFVEMGDKMINT